MDIIPTDSSLLLYQTEDGQTRIEVFDVNYDCRSATITIAGRGFPLESCTGFLN